MRSCRPTCRASTTTTGEHDPYSRGAYSYLKAGAAQAQAQLAQPLAGRLFFAGEATDTENESGTVTGALHSGIRAAAQILGRC